MTEEAVRPTLADAVIRALEEGEVTNPLGRDLILLLINFVVMRSVPNRDERKKLHAAYEQLKKKAIEYRKELPSTPNSDCLISQETMDDLVRVLEGAISMLDIIDRNENTSPDPVPST